MRPHSFLLAVPCLLLGIVTACGPEGQGDDDTTPAGDDDTTAASGLAPTLKVVHGAPSLTDLSVEAVARAPRWARPDLALALGKVEEARADELAALLLDLEDSYLVDEVAFSIGRLSPEVLDSSSFHPGILEENARLIYARDADLDYVTLVENGDPNVDDDFWTTATYRVQTEEGEIEERTIDSNTWYWYVVHPRLEDESPYYIDAWSACNQGSLECPTDAEGGLFWRDFLWDKAADECPEGRVCPELKDVLSGVDVLWKSRLYDRSDNGAIGSLVTYVIDAMEFGALSERSVQPNRVYGLGHGNCGEHSDITSAAARTALIPTQNVGAWGNDHTWNEFWDEGWVQWEPVNTYVGHYYYYADANKDYYRYRDLIDSDCDGVADDGVDISDSDGDGVTVAEGDCDDVHADVLPGAVEVENGRDDDCDGVADGGTAEDDLDGDGFTVEEGDCDDNDPARNPEVDDPAPSNNRIYAASTTRGDGWISQRTEAYGKTFTLRVTVQDRGFQPVDGAMVSVFGPILVYPDYEGYWWYVTEGVTDLNGVVELSLGEANAYAIRVDSAIGSEPEALDNIMPVVEWSEPGTVVEEVVTLGEDADDRAVTTWADLTEGVRPEARLTLAHSVDTHRLRGTSYMLGDTFDREGEGGRLDRFVVDEVNYQKFKDGVDFQALATGMDLELDSTSVELPLDRSWYVVFGNQGPLSTAMVGSVSLALDPLEDADWTEPVLWEEDVALPAGGYYTVRLDPAP